MSLARRPLSNRQHLVFSSVVILQHNKAERFLWATPGKRTDEKNKKVGRASVFQPKRPSFRPIEGDGRTALWVSAKWTTALQRLLLE